MFDRENLPGFALLGLCALVAIALLLEIFTDIRWRFDGPGWLAAGISLVGFGLIAYMSWQAWGKRLLGRKDKDEGSFTGNDVRTQRRRDRTHDDDPPA